MHNLRLDQSPLRYAGQAYTVIIAENKDNYEY